MGSEVLTPEGYKLYLFPAEKKKYKETVLFIHHTWGSHKTSWRHVEYLNEKGFDCITFNLLFGSDMKEFSWHQDLRRSYKGFFHLWTHQIKSVLNSIEGDKITYSFSGPSISTFIACENRKDIKKFICDGGPFHSIYRNTRNYFSNGLEIKSPLVNKVASYIGASFWGKSPHKKLSKVLSFWSKDIPILSIRGVADDIVEVESIRSVFEPHENLDLEILELRHGHHLDGLKNFPEQYKKTLHPFIKKNLICLKGN